MVVVNHVDVVYLLTPLCGGTWVGHMVSTMERTLAMEVLIAMLQEVL